MSDNSLVTLAVIALVISAIASGYSYVSSHKITSFVTSTDTAQVNLSVETSATINFTTRFINFSSGRVDFGQANATLETPYGNLRGNWSNQTGFILKNIGNVNLTINLSTGKTASTFLGGTGPVYQWNVSNKAVAGQTGACRNSTGGMDNYGTYNMSIFRDVSTTATIICYTLQSALSNNSVLIDVRLVVPSDSLQGALTDTFTAVGST